MHSQRDKYGNVGAAVGTYEQCDNTPSEWVIKTIKHTTSQRWILGKALAPNIGKRREKPTAKKQLAKSRLSMSSAQRGG